MTLILEFSPAEERELQTRAEREGLTLEEFARRSLLAPAKKTFEQMQAEAAAQYAASGETEEEMEAYINATVKQVRAEIAAAEKAAATSAP